MKKLFISIIVLAFAGACSNKRSTDVQNTSNTIAKDQAAKARNSEADTAINNIGTDRKKQ